jgi:mannitol-1-phosphate 5-dehydrogenase
MVPILTPEQRAEDPLLVVVEPYSLLPVDGRAFRRGDPGVTGFQLTDRIHAYEERKLFTHNMGHAVCAYLGFLAGHTWIWQAVDDPSIRPTLEGAFRETGQALIRRHGFSPDEQRAHENDLASRFANRRLGDTVARVGRDPLRKLGPSDRLVGAARLCLAEGVQPDNVARALAAALMFARPDDESAASLQAMLRSQGPGAVLERICGIAAGDPLRDMILAAHSGEGPA